jgi:glycosyltransferase involved in cell wall biosynthesis
MSDSQRPGTVAVVHFFSERTDGVSLQIHENDRVLSELGWRVVECSADAGGVGGANEVSRSRGTSGQNACSAFRIAELDYSTPQAQMFRTRDETRDEAAVEQAFEQQVQAIKAGMAEMIRQYGPQVIHVRNMLSLPIHPAATVAMAECIAEHPQVAFVTQHHDFSFEDNFVPGDRAHLYSLAYPAIERRVQDALLYTTPQVHHAVINSLMQTYLREHFGYASTVIPDAFDFATQTVKMDGLRAQIGVGEHDVVVGTMARIIPRKAMEVAVQLIVELRKRKGEFVGEGRGAHGRTITDDTRFLLLLPQASGLDEPENAAYFAKLREYAQAHGVETLYVGDRVVADSAYEGQPERDFLIPSANDALASSSRSGTQKGSIPFYSLYQVVDLLLFPSYQEGFGNQFLEAVALGEGVVSAHLYPVMQADIFPRIPEGGIITLGTNADYTLDEVGLVHLREDVLQQAVERTIHFLLQPEEERRLATETRQQLKAAFDARVIGEKLSTLFLQVSRR